MRSEEMRQARQRLVNVILNQACLSSALGHVAPDSATCRTAASSARSARVPMALRTHRVPLTGLGSDGLDPMWIRPGKDGRMRDRCTESMLFAGVPDSPIAHAPFQQQLSWQPMRTGNQKTKSNHLTRPSQATTGKHSAQAATGNH